MNRNKRDRIKFSKEDNQRIYESKALELYDYIDNNSEIRVFNNKKILVDKDFCINSGSINIRARKGYIECSIRVRLNGVTHQKSLSRHILNISKEFQGDHINGNQLDNRKVNLRICNRSENNCNKAKYSKRQPYKGIDI